MTKKTSDNTNHHNEQQVVSEGHNFVTTIRLNQPQKGNVLNLNNMSLLFDMVQKAIHSNDCRIIVIEGSKGVFSRGMDFRYIIDNRDEIVNSSSFTKVYADVLMLLRDSPKPVISVVDGEAIAGGLGIVLACDIVLASSNSIFALSEVLFGLIPAYVLPFLLERVSLKKARFMVLSSQKFTAEAMYYSGIVDEVIDQSQLQKRLRDYLKRLLFSNPEALCLVKRYSDNIFENKLRDSLIEAERQLNDLLSDKSKIDAINSFQNGDKMPWSVNYKKRKNYQN